MTTLNKLPQKKTVSLYRFRTRRGKGNETCTTHDSDPISTLSLTSTTHPPC